MNQSVTTQPAITNQAQSVTNRPKPLSSRLWIAMTMALLMNPLLAIRAVQAQTAPYCQLSATDISAKDTLRQAAVEGDRSTQRDYRTLLADHAQKINTCRQQSWLKNQAIWLRLYPCDLRPGALEDLMDRLVNRGYNQVYVEVFGNGQVLLPQAHNRTPWASMVRTPGYENRDLLAEAIAKGRERGLKVYAWMFTMNFGYPYAQRPEANQVMARNGFGQTSLTFHGTAGLNADGSPLNADETFIDPYSIRAKQEYYALVQAVTRRQPDGVLFDYIRYPRGTGSASVASRVQDLWIYGTAARQALYERAQNRSGQELIQRYLSRGYITATDLTSIASLYPNEPVPRWQGLNPPPIDPTIPVDQTRPQWQTELWKLTVAHAIQGILDFLNMSLLPVQRQGLPAGAVFFPDGNQSVGQGYDSRLQPWERFPSTIEWHPMAYGTCGHVGCIVAQVQRVVTSAPSEAQVMPVLAGTWGQTINGRPSLEAQMQAIHATLPQIRAISHFAYSWQYPQSDRDRKFCQL